MREGRRAGWCAGQSWADAWARKRRREAVGVVVWTDDGCPFACADAVVTLAHWCARGWHVRGGYRRLQQLLAVVGDAAMRCKRGAARYMGCAYTWDEVAARSS